MKSGDRPLKVLCLTTSFPSSQGDPTGFFVRQLVDAMADRGADIDVLTPMADKPVEEWSRSYRVHRFRYAPRNMQVLAQNPGGIPVALKTNRANLALVPPFLGAFLVKSITMGRRVDVILANWAVCGALGGIASMFHQKPVITVLRGSDVGPAGQKAGMGGFFLQSALKHSKAVVCVANDLAENIKLISPRPESIRHIPNGIHNEFFRIPPPRPDGTLRLLYAGYLISRKGVDILVQAMADLKDDNVSATIAGKGPLEVELKEKVRDLRLESCVTFVGEIPPGGPMAALLAGHHAMVLPSYHEGRPNVVLEALAGARPVIGSDIQGTRELILGSGAGSLFEPGRADSLVGEIRSMSAKMDEITEIGKTGRRWIIEQGLTWKNTADRYLKLCLFAVSSG